MTITYYILLILLAFAVSVMFGYVAIPLITTFCRRRELYDLPDARKVHHNNIPRLGGTCFMPCMFVSTMLAVGVYRLADSGNMTVSLWSVMFVASMTLVYSVGVIDDIVGVRPVVKLLVQVAAACLLPFSGLYINTLHGFMGVGFVPFFVGAPLTVFVVVYIMNAINLIDGIDGLASGLSLIALLGFLCCFTAERLFVYSVLIAGLAGVVSAFIYYNLTGGRSGRYKIFMGDSGSLTLGFVLAFLFVKLSMYNPNARPFSPFSMTLGYTFLVVPCFDVVRVSLLRLCSGQSLFKADKRHIHHRLLACGLSQHCALGVVLMVQLLYMAVNALMVEWVSMTWIVAVDVCLYVIFSFGVEAVVKYRAKS